MVLRTSPPPESEPALEKPPLHLLSPFERASFRFVDVLFRRLLPVTEAYNRTVGIGYVRLGSGRMVKVRGLERLAGLRPDDGILLVANHRSFFDLYELIAALRWHTPLRQPVMCPVRADFFYQRPLGVLVNLLASGGRMYPPFFREASKLKFNQWSLGRTAAVLRAGRVLVGFHPEGTRNRNPDPYTSLPAQPGVGKLVMETWPIVVPAFILGMSSNILADIKANFTGERSAVAVFGEPLDLSRFRAMSSRLATHKRIADFLLERIYSLGDEEKQARRELGLPPAEQAADRSMGTTAIGAAGDPANGQAPDGRASSERAAGDQAT
jgi:1-acyl-sn-glycerol-3-phosphate acyltransferase